MISNCGHDERGKYSGGLAGDQTGGEWNLIPWYNRPWNVVLRHPDSSVREYIALLAEQAAQNNNIGYDQGQRLTYWNQLCKANYNPSKIIVKCEADCSSGVLANVKAVGYLLDMSSLKSVDYTGYTGNMKKILTGAGFTDLTDRKYLDSPDYLLRGDILLYEGHHTATNVTTGVINSSSTSKGAYKVTAEVKDLVRGNKGNMVRFLQCLLIGHGYSVGNSGVDGSFGVNTESAVKKFQNDNNLNVNYPGTVGPKTWECLIKF